MNVAIGSESDADEAGIRILAEAALHRSFTLLEPIRVTLRGWTAVINTLPSQYKVLYWRPDADGLIIVLDSDETPVHDQSHEDQGYSHPSCRCCQLHKTIIQLGQQLARDLIGNRRCWWRSDWRFRQLKPGINVVLMSIAQRPASGGRTLNHYITCAAS